jgi:hypothetical protein
MADNIKIDLLINAAQSAKTIQETKKALRELKTEAMNLTEGTQAFTRVATAAGQLQDKIGDLSATTKYLGDDLKNIKAISGIGQGIAGGFAMASGAAALFGGENKKLQESMVKLQAIMAVMQGMEQVGAVLQKQSAAVLGIKNALTKTAIFLTSEEAVVEAASAAAKGKATLAQKALNLAMRANPIGILITLIIAGVSALMLWSNTSSKAAVAEKKANEEKKKSIELLKKQKEEQQKDNAEIAKSAGSYITMIEQLRQTNAGSRERRDLIKEINSTYGATLKNISNEKLFQDQLNSSVDQYIKFKEQEYIIKKNAEKIDLATQGKLDAQTEINKAQKEFIELEKEANKQGSSYRGVMPAELQDRIDKANTKIAKMVSWQQALGLSTQNTSKAMTDMGFKTEEAMKSAESANKKIVKSNADKNKAIEEANLRALERENKIRELYNKGITDAEEIRINLLEDGYEKEFELLRREKYKQKAEIENNNDAILNEAKQFEIDKLKSEGKYITDNKNAGYAAQQEEITRLAENNQKVIDLKTKNGEALNTITEYYNEGFLKLSEKYYGNRYLSELKQRAVDEQSILNEKYKNNDLSGEDYLKDTQKLADDLKIVTDDFNKNPDSYFQVKVDQDGKEPKMTADLSPDGEGAKDGAARIQKAKLRIFNIEKEADKILAGLKATTAEELVEIEKDKNIKLAEEQVKANAEIDALIKKHDEDVVAEEKKRAEMKVQAFVDLEAALQAAALSIFNNAMDQRTKANQKEYDNKIALIDAEQQAYENAQANRTTLQQAQYDAEQGFAEQKKNAERKRQIEEDKIKRKQFNAQKINDAANIAIKTAMAVMSSVAAFPLTGGMPFTAINIAIGAIEEAAVLSKKYIPTYAKGGLVNGPGTGTSDSINAKLSNGESVINSKSTSMFGPMLSAINQAGGGVAIPHTKNNIFNPSSSTSSSSVMDSEGIINAINELNNRPVETYVKEVTITNSQNRADKLRRRTSF